MAEPAPAYPPSYLATSSDIKNPSFSGRVWRDSHGVVDGTVYLDEFNRKYFCFRSAAEARAVAAACIACAEAMENFPPAGEEATGG